MVDQATDHLRQYRERNQAVDAYNQAVALAQKGDLDGAIARFDVVHEQATDAELALRAGEQADRLRKWRSDHPRPARKR